MDFYLTQGGATKKQSLEQYTRKLQTMHVHDNSEPAADILSDLPQSPINANFNASLTNKMPADKAHLE